MMANKDTDWAIYRRLLTYTHWGAFLLSIFGFMLYSIANVSVVQLISYLVDSLQGTSEGVTSQFTQYFRDWFGEGATVDQTMVPIAIVLIVMLRGLGTFIGNYFISYASTNMVHNLRVELFEQILRLPSVFYDRNALGHLVTKVTFHVTQVTGAATEAVKIVIREGFTVIGYLAFLLYLNWKLTLLFFTVAPIIALLVGYASRRFRRISERIQASMGEVTHVASEAIQGYREVRTFGGSEYERSRFFTVSNANRRQSMKMVVTASIATPVVQVLVSIALAALVWLVLDPSIRGTMSTGDIVAFISTGGLLAKPIRQLSEVNATIQKGLAAAKDIFSVFDEPIEVDSGSLVKESVKGKVEFRNVTFSYDDGDPVLSDVSFTANPGETIALVGQSGSGKSTMASLLPRFYPVTEGQILLDDVPVNDYQLENLRSHMAIVSQQVTLFNDTVRRNIAYGALHQVGDDVIRVAAEKAFAWEFVEELDHGLNTMVGDDGVLLSGGQRQRIAIARAFLKDAPVLILDEATSALDAESERKIQAALDAVVEGRTTIVIAHRLSTIEKADRILVVHQGKIVEEGTHDSLLAAKGRYASFYREGHPDDTTQDPTPETRTTPSIQASFSQERDDAGLLERGWYSDHAWLRLLTPFSYLFTRMATRRRARAEATREETPLPVIVVGNITVGGTGKTPLVAALVKKLMARGLKPGIVSRGYGGQASVYPMMVEPNSDPGEAGDEPVMLARATGRPVVVDPDRVAAVNFLAAQTDCNVVVSDDGLQHYAMSRAVEICVIDGARGLGNGLCLPAGPLREPVSRLDEVDFIVTNGEPLVKPHRSFETMMLKPVALKNLQSGDEIEPTTDGRVGVRVHAVAGIGFPDRFFATLREIGFDVVEHAFPDHYQYQLDDVVFDDNLPVIVTEKDAVKLRSLGLPSVDLDYWSLMIEAEVSEVFYTSVVAKAGLTVPVLKVVKNS